MHSTGVPAPAAISRRDILHASIVPASIALGASAVTAPSFAQPSAASVPSDPSARASDAARSPALRFGVHSFVWTGTFDASHERAIAEAAEIGFDGFEFALGRPDQVRAEDVLRWSERYKIAATVCATLPPHLSMASTDPQVRKDTVAHVGAILDLAHAVGLKQVVGPVVHPVGALSGHPPTPAEHAAIVECLKALGDKLEALDMRLALEPLNRFQGYLLNTVDQGLDLCARSGSARIGLLLDLFHMNIEETDTCAALRKAGERCFHIHVSARDRGAPGSDRFDWDELRATRGTMGYSGWTVFESFNFDDPIAAQARLWRPLAPTNRDLARAALTHLQRVFPKGADPTPAAIVPPPATRGEFDPPAGFSHVDIPTQGARLHAVRGGSGPALVLLAGWPQTWLAWRHLLEPLSRRFDVIALEMRGQGASEIVEGPYDTGTAAADVRDALDRLGIDKAYLIGHDVGAWIAFSLIRHHADRFMAAGLLDAAIPGLTSPDFFHPRNAKKVWQFYFHAQPELAASLVRDREREYLGWYFHNKAFERNSIPENAIDAYTAAYRDPRAMMAGFRWYADLPKTIEVNTPAPDERIRMPLFALGGEAATGSSLLQALRPFADTLDGGSIPACGHYIPEERPEVVLDWVSKTFAGPGGTAKSRP
jgi:sugar phosphate isomerase/epimerase/pimeloyl-ACP methyl ester carboxylesterase